MSPPRTRQKQKKPVPPHDHREAYCAWNQAVDQSGWQVEDTSYLDSKTLEHQGHAGGVDALIPFWIQGVNAAENGEEVQKMEQFYDKVDAHDDSSWYPERKLGAEWGCTANEWGESGAAANWTAAAETGGWGASPDLSGWGGSPDGQPQWEEGGWKLSDKGYGSDDTERQENSALRRRVRKSEDVETFVSKYADDAEPERRQQIYEFLEVRAIERLETTR